MAIVIESQSHRIESQSWRSRRDETRRSIGHSFLLNTKEKFTTAHLPAFHGKTSHLEELAVPFLEAAAAYLPNHFWKAHPTMGPSRHSAYLFPSLARLAFLLTTTSLFLSHLGLFKTTTAKQWSTISDSRQSFMQAILLSLYGWCPGFMLGFGLCCVFRRHFPFSL